MPETIFFRDLAFVLLAALGGGFVAHLLRLPLFLGYILGGALIGPFTPGPQVAEPRFIEQLAEIGVILLMFIVGLEFSLKDLMRMSTGALGSSLLGMLALIGLFLALSGLFSLTLSQALFIGTAISVTSTMVMAKLLTERDEIHSEHGRLMIASSLVEDLALVILLVLLPAVHRSQIVSITDVGWSLLKGLAILVPVLLLATRVMPPLIERVARTRNFELFLLITLTLSLGTAVLTAQVGLSPAMGAFLAGLIIGESDFIHETLARIVPLRDLFVALFFVSVGMLINPTIIWENWPLHALLVGLVVIAKGLSRGLIVYLLRYPLRVAFLVTLGFTQIGEFSFVLAKLGVELGALTFEHYNVILATALLSIFISTFLFRLGHPLWAYVSARLPGLEPPPEGLTSSVLSETASPGHVILCGYGRIGSAVGTALEQFNIPQVVIESDRQILAQLKDRSIPVIYGDAANERVCHAAHPDTATLAVIALPDAFHARQAFRNLKRLNPQLPIIARAHWDEEREALFREGVTEVIQPEFEGSIEMIRHALAHVGIAALDMESYLHQLRQQRYSRLLQEWLQREDPTGKLQKIQEVEISAGGAFSGHSLRECQIRERTGVSVIQVRHKAGEITANPSPDTVLHPGDRVVVMGSPSQLIEFLEMNRPRQ
jgi:CPA2 family monovalent cation:H+ antiporter-2